MSEDKGQDQRAELLRLWHEYGKAYNVFVPAEQPDPHDWDRLLPHADEKGTLDPQALKHWRYFERTRDFLRQRYAEHDLLPAPPSSSIASSRNSKSRWTYPLLNASGTGFPKKETRRNGTRKPLR